MTQNAKSAKAPLGKARRRLYAVITGLDQLPNRKLAGRRRDSEKYQAIDGNGDPSLSEG